MIANVIPPKNLFHPLMVEIPTLIIEYNLIQQKISKLPRSKRDLVENKIEYLKKEGKLSENQLKQLL